MTRSRSSSASSSSFKHPSLSVIADRRPSWAPTLDATPASPLPSPAFEAGRHQHGSDSSPSSSSEEELGSFKQSLQIDMKGMVGDAVGNMSISPTSRDVVLAARKGLFIIDLETPLQLPRFLPQGGTWDVADVQWNPHTVNSQYIISTSSEKLLVWNLLLAGKTSIEHTLHAHYRAITDINWHTHDPNVVASTSIDSWIWAWDLRDTAKPVIGFSNFNDAATQVKWNRVDSNLLASSHMGDVLLWDRRKGSLPVQIIPAHESKIYGIDWSHTRSSELVTCSLDKTIKTWDIATDSAESTLTFETHYPVWRARNLPFASVSGAVLALPQRSETSLEMLVRNYDRPVQTFAGHTDVVKEYVWRKRSALDDSEYQLITWSKDRTLRFWPVVEDVMQKVGHNPTRIHHEVLKEPSYRSVLIAPTRPASPVLSAPVGHRAILGEVLSSGRPHPLRKSSNAAALPPSSPAGKQGASTSATPIPAPASPRASTSTPIPQAILGTSVSGTMGISRVKLSRSVKTNVDNFEWLSSIQSGSGSGNKTRKRDDTGSSGPRNSRSRSSESERASRNEIRIKRKRKGTASASGSGSRAASTTPRETSAVRGGSQDDSRDARANQVLADEITSVILKLSTAKLKLEKHNIGRQRTCTFGLHGPWGGENGVVFIRITFTFPLDYRSDQLSDGSPAIDLERNLLVPTKKRAQLLHRLRTICDERRPALEPCLRLILYGTPDSDASLTQAAVLQLESDSSSDEDGNIGRRVDPRADPVNFLRWNKHLLERRSSQGVFGPNGELVCFFPPPSQRFAVEEKPAVRPPVLLSDAVRRLSEMAVDRTDTPFYDLTDSKVVKVMEGILTQQFQIGRDPADENRKEKEKPHRPSVVFVRRPDHFTSVDHDVATRYIISASDPARFCEENAKIATKYGRHDQAQIFNIVRSLVGGGTDSDNGKGYAAVHWGANPLARTIITSLYDKLSKRKDIQTLAMVSVALLQANIQEDNKSHKKQLSLIKGLLQTPSGSATPKPTVATTDYFTVSPRRTLRPPRSPAWGGLSSPTTPQQTSVPQPSSLSSRGSWSSLLNSSGARLLGIGSSTSKESASPPHEMEKRRDSGNAARAIPVPRVGAKAGQVSPMRMRRAGSESSTAAPTPFASRSWNEPSPLAHSTRTNTATTVASQTRLTFSQVADPTRRHERRKKQEKKMIVTGIGEPEESGHSSSARTEFIDRLVAHVYAYAEIMLKWQLFVKRAELLKVIPASYALDNNHHLVDVTWGRAPMHLKVSSVAEDKRERPPRSALPLCTVCRLPVKGLSHICTFCHHATHLACWKERPNNRCPSGCGCSGATQSSEAH